MAITKAYVDTAISGVGGGAPTGSIFAWPTGSAPTGYLICNSTAVSRSTYSDLFTLIGTTYGAGDGSTTFNVPNLRGRVIVGFDSGQTLFDALGETGGANTHTLTEAEMPVHTHVQDAHTHTQNAHNHTISMSASGTSNARAEQGTTTQTGTQTSGDATATNQNTTATNQNAGSGDPHNNIQPYITLNYIIKT